MRALKVFMVFAGGSIMLLGVCADHALKPRRPTKSTSSDNAEKESTTEESVQVVEPAPALSYQSCVGAIGGPYAEALCAFCIGLYTYATCVTFLIIVGDQTDTCKWRRQRAPAVLTFHLFEIGACRLCTEVFSSICFNWCSSIGGN